jgi:diguanylate cyclase (GGDEF)-like protein
MNEHQEDGKKEISRLGKPELRYGSKKYSWWDKTLMKLSIFSSDAPDAAELEIAAEAKRRVLLVIKARWALLGLLTFYSLYAYGFYGLETRFTLQPSQMAVALAAFLIVVAYNAWYHYSYHWFYTIKYLNQAQIILDIILVTVVVHYSGGVHSWFWTIYMLLTLEAAFLLERKIDTWVIGGFGGLLYGALLTAEYYNIITPVDMPYMDHALHHTFTYTMIVWFWVTIMNSAVALIGTYLMGIIQQRETRLRHMVVRDGLTELYNRTYFYHRLNSEIERSKRYDRLVSILLMDIDNFKRFNDTFGHVAGDEMIQRVADVFRKNIRRSETQPAYDVDIPCRYGGEEFAIVLPEISTAGGYEAALRLSEKVSAQSAEVVAERIRRQIEETKLEEDKGVTISVGVATYPFHGETSDELVRAADAALYKAKHRGKNCVVIADVPQPLAGVS